MDIQVDLWELVTHAGVIDDEEDDNDEWESGRGCDEDKVVHNEDDEDGLLGLIQKALPWLPLLLVLGCWSERKTSSLLSLCSRSLINSLFTQWITQSILLSTFNHTFSYSRDRVRRKVRVCCGINGFLLNNCSIFLILFLSVAAPYPLLLMPVHIHGCSVPFTTPLGLYRALVITQNHTFSVRPRGRGFRGNELWSCCTQSLDGCG